MSKSKTKTAASGRQPQSRPSYRLTSAERLAAVNEEITKRSKKDVALVVIRESDRKAFREFVAMLEKVLVSRQGELPGAATVLSLGERLVERTPEADALRTSLGAIPYYVPGSKVVVAWLFDIEGTKYLLGLYSAAKTIYEMSDTHTARMTNAFTSTLESIVREYGVTQLYTGPMNRILRSKDVAVGLKDALITTGTVLHFTVEGRMAMSDASARQNWDTWALFVEMAYRQTVIGLMNGTHNLIVSDRWPKAENQLPAFGYKFNAPGDSTVIPDLEQLDMVRDFLKWCAEDPAETSNEEIAQRLADKYKWGSAILRQRDARDEAATIADAKHPAAAVRNLLRKGLEVWQTGTYVYKTDLPPLVALQELDDRIQPYYKTVGNQRFVEYPMSFNHDLLPEGGWADEETFKAAARRLPSQDERPATGRAAGIQDRKPLAGIAEWIEQEKQYAISAAHGMFYLLIERNADCALDAFSRRAGWTNEEKTAPIATMDPAELHKTLAEAVIKTLDQDGVAWSRTATGLEVVATTTDINVLIEDSAKLRQQIDKKQTALDIALEEGYRDQAAKTMAALETLNSELRIAEQAIASAHANMEHSRPLAATEADVTDLATRMAELAETANQAPAELNSALNSLITSLRAELEPDELNVKLTAHVRIKTDDGNLILGPISCRVPNHQRKHAGARREKLLEYILADGMRLPEAAAAAGYTDIQAARRRANEMLTETVPSRFLRSAIIDCPIQETKAVVWEMHKSKQENRPFVTPGNVTAAFAAHIKQTYGSEERSWTIAWAADSHTAGRRALDFIKAAGEDGVRWTELLKHTAEDVAPAMVPYFSEELLRGKGHSRGAGYDPLVEKGAKFHSQNPDRKVTARRCPFCDTRTLTHIMRVPEIVGGLVCTECRKAPATPQVTFPEAYMKMWAGPRGIGKGRKVEHTAGTQEVS
jgi:hypothetical protein